MGRTHTVESFLPSDKKRLKPTQLWAIISDIWMSACTVRKTQEQLRGLT